MNERQNKRSCGIRFYVRVCVREGMKIVTMQREEMYLLKAEKGSVCQYILEEWLKSGRNLFVNFAAKRSWQARKG